jgi:hypothetical protein
MDPEEALLLSSMTTGLLYAIYWNQEAGSSFPFVPRILGTVTVGIISTLTLFSAEYSMYA